MKDLEENRKDHAWLIENLERPPTYKDRINFYLNTKFKKRPYNSYRFISIRGGSFPKLFMDNALINSKYNVFTFVPLVLFSLFKYFINLFYLSMSLSQIIPLLRVESPLIHLFPLSLVIFVYMLKEGIEDYKRHARDKEHNRQKFNIYSNKTLNENSAETESNIVKINSEKLQLGQIIMLKQGERVPADILLLKTSEPSGTSFVRTNQLDGETDWKLKRAVSITQRMNNINEIIKLYSITLIEEPKDDFYNFLGKMTFYYNYQYKEGNSKLRTQSSREKREDSGLNQTMNQNQDIFEESESGSFDAYHKDGNVKVVNESLNVDNIIWMNSILASGNIYGQVIYIGKDARSCLNSKRSRVKCGLFDKELNNLFIILISLMLGMCLVMLISTGFTSKWYIFFLKYLLLFSTLVPLSLRISLDIAKYVHNRSIVMDNDIPDTLPRTTVIPEELGRVSYLLTDKTGTLTQNIITLEKLYVSRGFYTHEEKHVLNNKILNYLFTAQSPQNAELRDDKPKGKETDKVKDKEGSKDKVKELAGDKDGEKDREKERMIINNIFNSSLGENLESRVCLSLLSLAICHNVTPIQSDLNLDEAERADPRDEEDSSESARSESRADELEAVKEKEEVEEIEFKASSPDEIALVEFANECGIKLIERNDNEMKLLINKVEITFKIMFIIPFSSEFKRMGIIVEDAEGNKHFFIKGAEVVIIPFLLPRGSVWLSEECDNLARMGLRTLVFGYRSISENEYKVFMNKYKEANLLLENRNYKIRKVINTLEHDLMLVGLTGVRDQLQKGVPSTLESLKNAGIKIWMLTGDKIDTAKCVAISSGLKQKNDTIYQLSVETLINPRQYYSSSNEYWSPRSPQGIQRNSEEGLEDYQVEKYMIDFVNMYNNKYNESNRSDKELNKLNAENPEVIEDEYINYSIFSNKIINTIKYRLSNYIMMPTNSVLMLDSFVISICINNNINQLLYKAAVMANSVICCRCTPLLKSELVKLLKYTKYNPKTMTKNPENVNTPFSKIKLKLDQLQIKTKMTSRTKKEKKKRRNKSIICCIGDGDNDVQMIIESDIGIGIVGKEGLQASLSSDYSITEFSHIKRLLLWHGRNSYIRSTHMSNFMIHRGVIITVMQIIFSSIYYFIPISFFQGWLLVGFTSYYNMVPIFCLVLDVHINDYNVMLYPELYLELKKGRILNVKVLLIWIWISIFQGTVLMVFSMILFENSLISLISIGCTSLFLLQIFNLISELNTFHKLTIIGIMLSSIVYFYSLLVFRNNFDMEFIARKSFFWKVVVISLLAWFPIYLTKKLLILFKPPQYLKLS